MRHSLLSTLALAVVLSGSAMAADMPVYKAAPPPPPVFSWTGVYIGVHAGGAWALKDWTTTFGAPIVTRRATDHMAATGFLGGAQIGFNYQTGPLVWGAEAQFSWSDLDGNAGCSFSGLQCHVKADWLGTAAARLGFAHERTMVFVKGGAAWIHDKYDISGQLFPFPSFATTQSRTGWMFGTGVEHAFWGNWSAKVEYDYLDFGTKTVNFTGLAVNTGYNDPVDIRQRVHLIKFGLNYRFGYDAPVTARY
jgi:outer membrane immunogenic protein